MQTVPVTLGWEPAAALLKLTATTRKLGASYDDRWFMTPSIALSSATSVAVSLTGGTSYVSRAAVARTALTRDTTYTFGYSIVMRTTEFAWVGSGSVTVTVGPDGALTPAPRSGLDPS